MIKEHEEAFIFQFLQTSLSDPMFTRTEHCNETVRTCMTQSPGKRK
jgi:hypothetical protein